MLSENEVRLAVRQRLGRLLLAADGRRQVGAGCEADALVSGNGDSLTGLAATDRSNLALLHLPRFESAKAREDDAVAGCQGLADAVQHCIESGVAL